HYSFYAPPTTVLYTLSLHDALPIWIPVPLCPTRYGITESVTASTLNEIVGFSPGIFIVGIETYRLFSNHILIGVPAALVTEKLRSEEHTSELQSRENLVCRLLLEKK